jgi:putative nucleotidyltransferase with HDIG domain
MTTPSKMRVLFVDDEPIILELIKMTVSSMAGEWDIRYATSAEEAMELLAKDSYGLVVSDMQLPGMSGAQLLNEVMRRAPATIRLILSGGGDRELVMKCAGATHQFMVKPFKLAELKGALKRINGLKQHLHAPEIQKLVAKRQSLPSIPDVYFKILEELQKPYCSVEEIGEIVATDPGFSVKLLQLVNSAFLGFAREVTNPAEAVMILGTGTIRSLALSLNVFSAFSLPKSTGGCIERVWTHSARVARLAQRIAKLEGGDEKTREEAFTAGLLHDVGQLILADNPATDYLKLLCDCAASGRALVEAERETLQATHADVGAYLLDLWGLPLALVEAVALHHEPSVSGDTGFGPLTAVHAANALETEAAVGDTRSNRLDLGYLQRLGLDGRVDAWRQELDSI